MTFSDSAILLVAAGIGSIGPTIAVVVGSVITQRSQRLAQDAAHKAQIATALAAENAAKAQTAAADAARLLVVAAKSSDARLALIQESSRQNMVVTNATHKIVNSQRTVMLRMVAALSRRVAKDNPHDNAAQLAAEQAERDAFESANANANADG